MNSAPPNIINIPVLTEVISVDNTAPVVAQVVSATTETPSVMTMQTVADAPVSQPGMSTQDLEQLEKTVRENVLRQLLSRVDFVLEHRVRDGLADVLQTAVDGLANDIRQGLTKSLEEVIHRTISQEISKIQSSSTSTKI